MERKPQTRSINGDRSFANGNGPATIVLPLEGHVIDAVHWWWLS
jgi:hypothetical protein